MIWVADSLVEKTLQRSSSGEKYVRICNKSYNVAELVLLAFSSAKPPRRWPCFLDGDKSNCQSTNLYWGLRGEPEGELVGAVEIEQGYFVRRDGVVFSIAGNGIATGELRRLAVSQNSNGYPSVHIAVNGRRKHLTIHSLVARAFHGPKPTEKSVVRHLDGNPFNSNAGNLAWGTVQENTDDSIRHGTKARGSRNGNSRLTEDIVRQIRHLAQEGVPNVELAKRFDIDKTNISCVVNRKTWRHI
jgi:hypothetical protein